MKKGEIWKWVLLVIAILALFMKTYIGLAIWAICLYLYLKQRKKQKEEKEQEEKKKQEELAREKRERELEAQRLENERKAKFEAEYALYKEDAEQGKVEAMRNLGNAYRRYYKWSDAKYWYKKAAERNDVEALFALINDYAIFGTSQAKECADQMASNPYASDEEKRRAVLMKVEIERYEYKQKEEAEAAARRRREEREAEQRRIEEIRTRAMMERNLAVTGDYFAVRPGESYCINEGDSCRFCARRTWASDEGWRPSSRCYL